MSKYFLPLPWLVTTLVAADKVTFDDHVFPLFQQACLNCHNPDKAKGGLDLSSFAGTLKGGSGGKIVEPGDTGSTLINLVKQTAEPIMPPEGEKLGAEQIAVLTAWIEGGLLENKNSSARKPGKPKFEAALRSDPSAKPDGPPPMPEHLLLEPPVVTERAAAIHSLAASPWAPLLAVTGQRQVLLHHMDSLELVGILPFPEGEPVALSFTPDGRYLIVGGGVHGKFGVTVTYDVTTGERVLVVGKEFDAILAVDIRPGFDLVATGSPSRLLKLWNTGTGEQVQSVKKHTEWITALDISPDGVLLASGDRNGGVWVWESDTANEFHTLRAHQAAITATVFRADSNILATASEDGTVRYWEMNNGGEVRKNDAHPGGVTALAMSRDGSTLTAGRDLKAKLWKPDFAHSKDLVHDLPTLPTAVALDGEGRRAFVGDANGIVHVFDTEDARRVGELVANPPTIAVRLERIGAEIAAHPAAVAAAEKQSAEATAALETARTAVADAEKQHREAVEVHNAARAAEGEAKQKLEAHRQGVSAKRGELERVAAEREQALAAIEPARQALAAAPEEQKDPAGVAALEKAHADLTAQASLLEQELAAMTATETSLSAALEGATQAAVAAEAPVKPAEDAIAPARKSAEERDAAGKQAAQALENIRAGLAALEAARKRWSAAAINTQAIDARAAAQLAGAGAEEQLDTHAAALVVVAEAMESLQARRAARSEFAAPLATADALPTEIRAEVEATLAALDRMIELKVSELRQLEDQAISGRRSADQALPAAHRDLREAERLREEYLAALADGS